MAIAVVHRTLVSLVGRGGDVNRDLKPAGQYTNSRHVVGMLVGDDNGVERSGVFVGLAHAAEELAATKASIDEDSGFAAGDNRTVSLGARRQDREPHHEVSITREPVHLEGPS